MASTITFEEAVKRDREHQRKMKMKMSQGLASRTGVATGSGLMLSKALTSEQGDEVANKFITDLDEETNKKERDHQSKMKALWSRQPAVGSNHPSSSLQGHPSSGNIGPVGARQVLSGTGRQAFGAFRTQLLPFTPEPLQISQRQTPRQPVPQSLQKPPLAPPRTAPRKQQQQFMMIPEKKPFGTSSSHGHRSSCHPCAATSGRDTRQKHCRAKKHESAKSGSCRRNNEIVWCAECCVPCMNEDCLTQHRLGKRHLARIAAEAVRRTGRMSAADEAVRWQCEVERQNAAQQKAEAGDDAGGLRSEDQPPPAQPTKRLRIGNWSNCI